MFSLFQRIVLLLLLPQFSVVAVWKFLLLYYVCLMEITIPNLACYIHITEKPKHKSGNNQHYELFIGSKVLLLMCWYFNSIIDTLFDESIAFKITSLCLFMLEIISSKRLREYWIDLKKPSIIVIYFLTVNIYTIRMT